MKLEEIKKSLCNHKVTDLNVCSHFLTSELITGTPTEGFLEVDTGRFTTEAIEDGGVCKRLARYYSIFFFMKKYYCEISVHQHYRINNFGHKLYLKYRYHDILKALPTCSAEKFGQVTLTG